MSKTTVSVIINTHNRAPYLRRLLPALERQTGVDFEVVVVNGPSTDDTASVLAHYHGRIKVVNCPTSNLSLSRNLGIAASAGEVVAFIDDDALPIDERWLARYAEAFAAGEGRRLGAVGGPVLHRDTARHEFNGGATSDYGFQIFDVEVQGQVAVDNRRWFPRVAGGNCAYSRAALADVGGFDERYAYYLDESDLCVRLVRAGWGVRLIQANAIRHYSAPSERRTSKYDRNWRTITRSDTYYALKNGADAGPRRLVRTLRYARHKPFFKEIASYRGEIGRRHHLRLLGAWTRGLGEGLWSGLAEPRLLAHFRAADPLLPFARPAPSQPLRVALLTQTVPGQQGYGGVGRYTFDLARGLHERGHEVHIFCRDEQRLRHYSLGWLIHGISAAESSPGPSSDGRPILAKNLAYGAAVVRRLQQLFAEGVEFDVVHASNWDAEGAALIRAQLYPTALMLVSPLAQVIQTEQWAISDDLRACVALDRWQIEHADLVCVPSEGVLDSYRKLMGVAPGTLPHLRRSPLGIVPDVSGPTPLAPGAPRRLLFVGRLERRKGAHTLLGVLPELLARFPDWVCDIVGNDQVPVEGGTLKGQFLQAHRGAPWLGRVRFHGMVDEAALREHYRACDLFVAPSLFESFGLIYHEAMQYGKAVVGCRTGGVPEVVADGEEGLLVAPDTPAELLTALASLMGDDALRERMGRAGLRRVAELMNYRTMAADLEAAYTELIGYVGEKRRQTRHTALPRALPLFAPDERLTVEGLWERRDAAAGHPYLLGAAGAQLSFVTRGGSQLRVVALRHSWSGVLEVCLGDCMVRRFDLFKEGPLELRHVVQLTVPGDADERVPVTLRVHEERNPASHASQIWLAEVAAVCVAAAEVHS